MEFYLYMLAGAIILIALSYTTRKLSHRVYRSEWVERGRDYRRQGIPRQNIQYEWIQDYFDEGYYGND